MSISRRRFLTQTTAAAAGFGGLRNFLQGAEKSPGRPARNNLGHGPLARDPAGILDLPAGFQYQIIGVTGARMEDGYRVPGSPDGMGTFAGPDGLTVIIRNHELNPNEPGPWGADNHLLSSVDRQLLYDRGSDKSPGCGGTTTIVYDTQTQTVVRQFLSLAGTWRNCAGGPTPWNSWITCEETTVRAGFDEESQSLADQDHGYNFEVPATTHPTLAKAVPLKAMGRFNHEAVAVEPKTGIVYQTEDRWEGLFYRFIPHKPGALAAGGRLQALAIRGQASRDTRNWIEEDATEVADPFRPGRSLAVEWIDLEGIDAPDDDLRFRGFSDGAARFARGEGIWRGDNEFYFACTNGGRQKKGQIWRYVPSPYEGTPAEANSPGKIELFIEPHNSQLIESADNLTIAPWGDLIVCEDRCTDVVRIVGVTTQGKTYSLARNRLNTEFSGAVFSPDGSTLFVNIQSRGLTLAVTGPWRNV